MIKSYGLIKNVFHRFDSMCHVLKLCSSYESSSRLRLLALSVWIPLISLEARAVTAATPSRSTSSGAQEAGVLRLDLPISWQMTRSSGGSDGHRAATLTATYHEIWKLEVRAGSVVFLTSPRARIEALPAAGSLNSTTVPTGIVVTEEQLARLLGIDYQSEQPNEKANSDDQVIDPSRYAHPVTIYLSRRSPSASDVSLNWSEDVHYAIHLDVGNTAQM